MLSICIPLYNFNINPLLEAIYFQIGKLDYHIEVIVIDDCSTKEYPKNKDIAEKTRIIHLSKNVGRAKIRNLFLEYVSNDFILFLDCDTVIEKHDFIENYLNAIKSGGKVICGGREYHKQRPEQRRLLRWRYGILRETKSYTERSTHPYHSFMTNNFVIGTEILKEVRFDESITGYGHEDTLFGFQLESKGVPILHIDNSTIHGDLETNEEFISKTQTAIENLVHINRTYNHDLESLKAIRLLNVYSKLGIAKPLVEGLFRILKPWLISRMHQGTISMYLFDFYKLGYLIEQEGRG